MDVTGSMQSCICKAREQIDAIIEEIQTKECKIDYVAFVGYRDWCDKEKQFEILCFTKDINVFKAKLQSIEATGGGDIPEDVLGGLAKAAKMEWPESSGTRVLFHLGDAPPHGSRFFSGGHDEYSNGHPSDMSVDDLFGLMASKYIEYYFGEFNNSTDKMKAIFSEACGRPVDEIVANASGLDLLTLVTDSIMRSVSSSIIRASVGGRLRPNTIAAQALVTEPPDWSLLPEISAYHIILKPVSLREVIEGRKLEVIRKPTSLKVAPSPFSKGASRLAFFGKNFFRSSGSTSIFEEYDVVYKQFLHSVTHRDHRLEASRYMTDLETQTVAAQVAFQFQEAVSKAGISNAFHLKYLKAKLVAFKDPATGCHRYMAEEKLFRGRTVMVKYTNNSKFVQVKPPFPDRNWDDKLEFLLAFSHFSFVASEGYLLVTDLQGISIEPKDGGAATARTDSAGAICDGSDKEIILTDPAIHCAKHPRFGSTNLGDMGMNDFKASHKGKCNKYCRALKLPAIA